MLVRDSERLKRVQEELKRKMNQRKGNNNPYAQALNITQNYKRKIEK